MVEISPASGTRNRPGGELASAAMTDMKCDECERLLQYRTEVVAVYDEGGQLRAKLVVEDSPGTGEAARLGATLKFHSGCYDSVRVTEPNLPALVTAV
jgi:hypothetical protein